MVELSDLLDRLAATPPAAADVTQAARLIEADPVTACFRSIGIDLPGAADRADLFHRTAHLCPVVPLSVAGHGVEARITPEELWRYYLPLRQAAALMARRSERRVLIGVTGPGASGKSVFAGLLCRVMNTSEDALRAAICPQDGFHYPNAYLDSHLVPDAGGAEVPLRRFKGSPRTFDAEGFIDALRRLRTDDRVGLPRYDRQIHDPVPDAIRIGPGDRIIIVEGNSLLVDDGRWSPVRGMLDLALYFAVPLDAVRDALIARHILGGRTPEDARAHFDRSDRPNYDTFCATAPRADLIVTRDAEQRIAALALASGAS